MSVTTYTSVRECKVSRHVCIGLCLCLYIYGPVYASMCVCGVREDKSPCIFGTRPAEGKEGKLAPAVFSPPASFRNTKGHRLVPACFLITFLLLICKTPLPAAATLFSVWVSWVDTAQHSFPTALPHQAEGWFWAGHVTWAGPLRHFTQDFAAGTSREECLCPLG